MLDIHNHRVIQGFVVFNLMWVIRGGVTPYVNSKYLPLMPPPPPPHPHPPSNPYPFFTSLYRAPQTYDRGKTMSMPRKPYILISKLRPCFGNQDNAGRHFDKLQRPNNHAHNSQPQHDYYRPPVVKFTETRVQHVPPFQQFNSPHNTEEFSGSWAITKPDNDPTFDQNTDKLSDKVTYNEDGTRVLPESTLNYNVDKTQLNNELFTTEGDGGDAEPTSYTFAETSSFFSPSASPPPPMAYVNTTPSMIPTAFNTITTPDEITSTDIETTFETTTIEADDERTVLQETTETTPATHRESLTTAIMDKLGGGAKNMLVQILGGILNGGQSQNFKDKAEKQLSEKTILENPSFSTNFIVSTESPNKSAYTFPSYFNHPPEFHSTINPGQTDTTDDHSQDTVTSEFANSKEAINRPTVTTSEVRTSGEHPLIAMATSLAPNQQIAKTEASSTVRNKEEERGSTSGWRPLQWPAFWPKKPPSQQRPPSPPANILTWVHTSWNDSSSTHENYSTDKTESEKLSFELNSNQSEIITSTSIPRLPSSFIEKNNKEIPSKNGSKGPPLLLVDWLLGTSQNTDTGNKNQTIININGNLTDLMKYTEYENKTIDELESNGISVSNSNVSRNWTADINNNEWTGRKNDISDPSTDNANTVEQITENKDYKQEMINVESAIQEMKKLYEKLRLGIPTPFHIFRHLKTLHPTLKNIQKIAKH